MNGLSYATRRPACAVGEALETRLLLSSATVGIDSSTTFQTIDGFGAAMITWRRPNEYRQASFYDLLVNDLGATMARTAIWPMFETTNDDADPNHINWDGFDFSSLDYAMDFFQRLQERGVDQFMATVWTPPYWMKTNRSFYDAGMLRGDMRDEFAEYLAAVSIASRDRWGINLSGISLQNEPFFVQSYESAIYNPQQMREAVRAVQRRFAADNIDTPILIPEDLAIADRMLWYVQPTMNDPETQNFNGHFLGHGYLGTSNWNKVRTNFAPYGRKFWQTESSGQAATWSGAMSLGEEIYQTLALGNANAYLYWQFSDSASSSAYALMNDGVPNPKYYAAKQFYRYIRPGAQRIAATSSNSSLLASSYVHPQTGATTVVLVNKNADATDVQLNLSGLGVAQNYRVYRSSATENSIEVAPVSAVDGQISLSVPPQSIVTLYSGQDLVPQTGIGGHNYAIRALKDTGRATALHDAAESGSLSTVQTLIHDGANVNAAASDGWTPLHSAASCVYWDAPKIVQELLNAGANINATTTDGWTPLHAAAANTTIRNTVSPSMPVEKLQALIDAGADIEARDVHGRTPLHYAAMMGKMVDQTIDDSLVEALLAAGADPNVVDDAGMTPLDYATREGYEPIRQALLAAGADTTPPTADIIDVSPDPRDTAVSSIVIQFSEPVTGVDLSDLSLTRDGGGGGGGNLLGSGITLSSSADKTTYTLGNLANVTAAPGQYVVTLSNSASANIRDYAGNLLAAPASESWTNVTSQQTIALPIIEDSYVRDGSYANDIYGDLSEFAVKKSNSAGYAREAYLKIDLRSLTDITEATLRLYGRLSNDANANIPTEVFGVTDTTWTESTLKWNNKPASSGSALSSATIANSAARWYEWNLTSYLRSRKAAGAQYATVVLKNSAFSSTYTIFNSGEAADNRPELRITQSIADATPPTVSSVSINGGAVQRSNLTSITLRFSEPMNLGTLIGNGTIAQHVGLYDALDGQAIVLPDVPRFSYDASTYTLTMDLTTDGLGGGNITALANGRFELRLSSGVTDVGGNPVSFASQQITQSTSASAADFFRLAGDLNGNAAVNLSDLGVLATYYGTTNPLGDCDGDGDVDLADLGVLSSNYGLSL